MGGHVMEILSFRLKDGVRTADFLVMSDGMGRFLAGQSGYLDRKLTETDDGEWTDFVTWRDMASVEAASDALLGSNDPDIVPFLRAIDERLVTLRHVPIRAHDG